LQTEKILTAAAQLFATHRFHEARMEDIAAVAEVGKGTLYRYFKDKEELYTALLVRAGERLSGRLRAEVDRGEGPRRQLVAIVRALLGFFEDNPYLLDLIQHAEALQRPGHEFPWQKTRGETMALVRSVFEAGRQAGEFHIDDPELAMLMLLGGLRAIGRFAEGPRAADLPERIVENLLAGHARPLTNGRAPRPFAGSAN
jgi:AcrR family transcriptional regulator